jgi:hypothetical protein
MGPITLLAAACCGREVGYGPMVQTAIELRTVSEALLLGAVGLYKYVDDSAKGCYALIT